MHICLMLYRFTDGLCEKMSRKKNSGFNFVTFKCSCVLKNKIKKTAVLYIYMYNVHACLKKVRILIFRAIMVSNMFFLHILPF